MTSICIISFELLRGRVWETLNIHPPKCPNNLETFKIQFHKDIELKSVKQGFFFFLVIQCKNKIPKIETKLKYKSPKFLQNEKIQFHYSGKKNPKQHQKMHIFKSGTGEKRKNKKKVSFPQNYKAKKIHF